MKLVKFMEIVIDVDEISHIAKHRTAGIYNYGFILFKSGAIIELEQDCYEMVLDYFEDDDTQNPDA